MGDGSKGRPKMTAGLDIGDRYSHLCLIDTESGEVVEEGRLRTSPEALRRRFSSEQQPLRIAIETGTHSPWVSQVLEGCGHDVLVANSRKLRLIYANKRKTDEVDALRTSLVWCLWIRSSCYPVEHVEVFLHEGLLQDAIAAVESSPVGALLEQVADAAVESHPDWIIGTCRRQAAEIMEQGKSQYYSKAIDWLAKVKAAYLVAGRGDEWRTYLSELITRHQRKYKLRPMLEDLAK